VRVRARRRKKRCTTKIIRKWAMKGERKMRDETEGVSTKRTAARDLCNERRARAAVPPPKDRRGRLGQADETLLTDEFTEILGKVFFFE
jgi:hypothetical protein